VNVPRLPLTAAEAVGVGKTGQAPARPAILLPGSFNPVHAGHWRLADAAARRLGAEVAFELSVANVDKAALTPEEVERRLAQFADRADVWLTRAPTFVDKARLFPGVVFVVGADTAARVVCGRYYGDERALEHAIQAIRDLQCRFLVAPRTDASGCLLTAHAIAMPPVWRPLFEAIDPAEFRVDLSSTQLRTQS